MTVSAELLRTKIRELEAQRDNALAVHQQATGAILLAEYLLEVAQSGEQKDSMTLQEFAETLGGVSAEIVENTSNG